MCRVLISLLRRSIISLLCRVIISFSCHNPSGPSIGPSTGSDVQPAHRANGGHFFPPAFVLSCQWSSHVGDGQTTIRRSDRARRFQRPGSTRPSGTHRASHLRRALTIPHAEKRRTVAITTIGITMTTSMMRKTARTPAHGINPTMSRHRCRRDESRASLVPQLLLPRPLHHNAASCTQYKRSGRARDHLNADRTLMASWYLESRDLETG